MLSASLSELAAAAFLEPISHSNQINELWPALFGWLMKYNSA